MAPVRARFMTGFAPAVAVKVVLRPPSRADKARARFKSATQALAAEARFPADLTALPDLELLEAVTALTLKK